MRVLLLTQVLPHPPDSGPKIKTGNLLKHLAPRHDVTLVSFVRGDQSADARHLEQHCRAVHTVPITRGVLRDLGDMARSGASQRPFLMTRDDRAAMRRVVEEVSSAASFDIAHSDQLNMAQYAERVPRAARVLDAHNALWLVCQRLSHTASTALRRSLLERESRLLREYEGRHCRQADVVLAVSEADRTALRAVAGPAADIRVVPIPVDTDEIQRLPRTPDADRILHIGTMHWPPNADGVRWFITAVFPRIRAARPAVTFDVVGARPPRSIRRLARVAAGLNVTGHLADPGPYLCRAGVVVVPVRAGGGVRVKILTALAHGLPVVSTTLGCEGLEVEPGRHLLVADRAEDFAAATLRVLGDEPLAQRLGENGRRLVEQVYDYRLIGPQVDTLYEAAVSRPQRR